MSKKSKSSKVVAPVEVVEVVAPAPFVLNPLSVKWAKDFCEVLGLVVEDSQIRYIQSKGDCLITLQGNADSCLGRISIYADSTRGRVAGLFSDGKRVPESGYKRVLALLGK